MAYANKAIGIFWALLWGVLLFRESVSAGKIAAVVLVAGGTVLMNLSPAEGGKEVSS